MFEDLQVVLSPIGNWCPVLWLMKVVLVMMVGQVLHLGWLHGVVPGGELEVDDDGSSALVSRSRKFLGRR